jgi:hypothetical protein
MNRDIKYQYLWNKNKYFDTKIMQMQAGATKSDNISFYDGRINKYNEIKLLAPIFFSENDCMIDTARCQDRTLIKYTKEHRFMVTGGQGAIYFMKITPCDTNYSYVLAIKIVPMDQWMLDAKNLYNPMHRKWKELYVLKQCNDLVTGQYTQNLLLLYHDQICKSPDNSSLILYSELADGNLMDWLKEPHTVHDWKTLFFQVWNCLDVLQKKLKLVHNDLRFPNILFIKTTNKESYRYKQDNDYYYLDNIKYIFILWDFGSSQSLLYCPGDETIIKNKIEMNSDLYFLHDMYNRIRVISLIHRYNVDDFETIFKKQEMSWLKQEKEYNKKKFGKKRFEEKYKISMAYRLIETDRFDKYYNKKIHDFLPGATKIYIPEPEIDQFLGTLSRDYNYQYNEALNKNGPGKKKIPSTKFLIDTFLPEFKTKKPYDVAFK